MTLSGYIILALILIVQLLELTLSLLNRRHTRAMRRNPPEAVLEFYPREKVDAAAAYELDKSRLSLLHLAVRAPLFYTLFLSGILAAWSAVLNQSIGSEVLRGLIFFASWSLFFFLIALPFDLYDTFRLEKRYGFGRTTPGTYIRDHLIQFILSGVLLTVILAALITFIRRAGSPWWLYAAGFLSALTLFLTFIYPTFIAPLFNRFEPLEPGALRDGIEALAHRTDFPVDQIFRMDASRRSHHSNAYFTGLGRRKRIVLFDTLINNHERGEIIAILAHEIGHYKLGHVRRLLGVTIISIFAGMFLVGLFINHEFIYRAFGFEKSIYAGLFLVSILFSPLGVILNPLAAALSRRHEYAADRFAVEHIPDPHLMAVTLAHLHRDNLSNPYPHPWYVWFHYSHPTLLERIQAIMRMDRQHSSGGTPRAGNPANRQTGSADELTEGLPDGAVEENDQGPDPENQSQTTTG